MLDPLGPLVEVLEEIDCESVLVEDACSALSESLRLLWRSKRAPKAVNSDIQDLTDKDKPFAKAYRSPKPTPTFLDQEHWILDTVQGYKIEFLSEPVQHARPARPRHTSAEPSLIMQEAQKLLQKGAVRELAGTLANPGLYSNLFLVPMGD